MVSTRLGKPIYAPPGLSEVSLALPVKQFWCWSDWRWPFSVLSRKLVERFLFPRLSLPRDRCCDISLSPQVESHPPQDFRSSGTKAALSNLLHEKDKQSTRVYFQRWKCSSQGEVPIRPFPFPPALSSVMTPQWGAADAEIKVPSVENRAWRFSL